MVMYRILGSFQRCVISSRRQTRSFSSSSSISSMSAGA
jgi:hypothetical protein